MKLRFVSLVIFLFQMICCDIYAQTNDEVDVPSNVSVIYVILQKPGLLVDGSSELLSIDDRESFINNFMAYKDEARNRKMRLIITAATEGEKQWVHSKIKYNGAFLKQVMYRDPNQSKSYIGSEVPL